MHRRSQFQGFTLIEILITMLILSIGLLSIAALQINALKQSQTAYYQSLANVQLASMLERLRANHSAAARVRECAAWNKENNELIAGKGECNCDGNTCTVILQWKNQTNSLTVAI